MRTLLAIALVLGSCWQPAFARTEQMRWTQQSPEQVSRFVFSWGTAPGTRPNTIIDGKPGPDAQGVYRFDLTGLPDTGTLYFAARAEGPGGISPWSNEISRTAQAPPPPSPTTFTYRLISMPSGFVVGPMQDGSTIPADGTCYIIEIIPSAQPATLAKQLDGGTVRTEGNPPYGWEDDTTSSAPCRLGTLAVAGPHRLDVTARDSSGAALGSDTLDFVVGGQPPPPPPPPPAPLVAPGKPRFGDGSAICPADPSSPACTVGRRDKASLCWTAGSGPIASQVVTLSGANGATHAIPVSASATSAAFAIPPALTTPIKATVTVRAADGRSATSPASLYNHAYCPIDLTCNGVVNTTDRIPSSAAGCALRMVP